MKKILLLLSVCSIVLLGCKKNEFQDMKPVQLNVAVGFDADLNNYNFSADQTLIKLINLDNGEIIEAKTNSDGMLYFPSLVPGTYDIQALLVMKAQAYSELTNIPTAEDVQFNAVLERQVLIENNTQLKLALKTGRIGDWVFKQIYYAGSNTTNGAGFRDQFIEIYNNSNELMYADSLYFGQVFGVNKAMSAIDPSLTYYQKDNLQYDWTKSIGMNNAKANSDYVYAKSLFMIPGTGKQYPVKPGESIIIAQNALNHQAPFIGHDGKTTTVKMPELTIDLSAADFEVYLGDLPDYKPLNSDVNTPAPNVVIIERGANKDFLLDNLGRDAFIIFKSNINVGSFSSYPAPDEETVTHTTKTYMQIPAKLISDAVEIKANLLNNQVPKRLPNQLDASASNVTKGSYSSQSLIRKTAKTINGRRILLDTNNSATDFSVLDYPDVTKTIFR